MVAELCPLLLQQESMSTATNILRMSVIPSGSEDQRRALLLR